MNGDKKSFKMNALQSRSSLISKSKYELNLAEFPISILSKRLPKGIKAIEYQDTIAGREGQVITRKWKVSPSSEYGFGTNKSLETLFELFQIWKEQGFETPFIHFGSTYNLIKRMDLEDAAYHYERIKKDLNAFVGITIEAKNAFWDNEKKAYVDKTFHIFEEVAFYRREGVKGQQPLPLAYIKASESLWGSIEANALTTLKNVDSNLFRSFTPTEQRLALYLGKMLHQDTEHRREVIKLVQQLPILAKSHRHAKEQLSKSCDGLLEKKFPYLTAYRYEKKRDGQGENIIFYRKEIKAFPDVKTDPQPYVPKENEERHNTVQALLIQDILDYTGDSKSRSFYALAVQKLSSQTIYQVLSETKAADIPRGTVQNRGAYFTKLIMKYAAEKDITLNPKKRRNGGDLSD